MRARSLGAVLAALCLFPFLLLTTALPSSAAGTTDTTDTLCDGHVATIVGTPGDDTLEGTDGPDVIAGLGGNDTIHGLGGDDIVCGDDGSDQLYGGPGADRLFGGHDEYRDVCDDGCFVTYGDLLDGGPDSDFLDGGRPGPGPGDSRTHDGTRWTGDIVSFADDPVGVHLDLRTGEADGAGHDTLSSGTTTHALGIIGSAHDDVIIGTAGYQDVDAGAGDDLVETRAGGDTIHEATQSGNDRYVTADGSNSITLVDGSDRVSTGGEDDEVEVGAETTGARVSTGAGSDHVTSDALGTAYAFHGGSGPDTLALHSTVASPITLRLDRGQVVEGMSTMPADGFESWSIESASPLTAVGGAEADHVNVEKAPRLTASLGGGPDLLVDGADAGRVRTGAGNDTIWAPQHGAVKAWLGSGDDLLKGQDDGPPYQEKVVDGGRGHDRFAAKSWGFTCTSFEQGACRGAFQPPQCDGKAATIVGTLSGHETIQGTDGDDVIVANGPYDTIDASGGDDTVCGGGAGQIAAGSGNDTVVGQVADSVTGGAGDDHLRLDDTGRLDYSAAPGPVTLDLATGSATGDGSDTISVAGRRLTVLGSAYADHLTGGDEADTFLPGNGDDTVVAGGGADVVEEHGGDSGDDTVDLGPGDDSYSLASGSDSVAGGEGDDSFYDSSDDHRGPVSLTGFESTSLFGLHDGDSTSGGPVSWRVDASAPTTIDLGSGTIVEDGKTGHFSGVNPNFWGLQDTTVNGTDGVDHILVEAAGSLTAHLLGGDDHLAGDVHGGTADLGAGDDLVTGTYVGVALDGGAGTDTLQLNAGSGNTCTNFESGACNP